MGPACGNGRYRPESPSLGSTPGHPSIFSTRLASLGVSARFTGGAIVATVYVEYDPSENVWVTYVPALDHMSTFGCTRDEALVNTREAMVGYLEAADKEGVQLTVDPLPLSSAAVSFSSIRVEVTATIGDEA